MKYFVQMIWERLWQIFSICWPTGSRHLCEEWIPAFTRPEISIAFESGRRAQLTAPQDEPDRAIWETRPGRSFIRSAESYFHVEEHRGSFNIGMAIIEI